MTTEQYLTLAYQYAQQFSTDQSTQNGAVLVPAESYSRLGLELIYGANHFPKGVKESPERWERPTKYAFVEHAERNAIYAAAKAGVSTDQATMFVPWFACSDCARAIIQAGIKEVVGHDTPVHSEANPHWKESIQNALDMLDEAGVKYRYYSEPLNLEILFNGVRVTV